MGRITRGIGKAFDTLDFIEMVIYGFGAAALMGVGLYLGIRAALDRGGPILASAVAGLLVLALGLVVRDVRRKAWSPISIFVAVVWALCILALIAIDAFGG